MPASGVYCILNVQNGMRYVGSSKRIPERMEHHFHMLEEGRHHNYLLQQAFNSCGDVWSFIVLEYCSFARLEATEQKWINRMHNRLYNIQLTVDRSIFNDDTD